MNASSMIAAAPTTHEMIAAGPAIFVAFSAPSSQPEPITDPTEVNIRPIRPKSRRSDRAARSAGCPAVQTACCRRHLGLRSAGGSIVGIGLTRFCGASHLMSEQRQSPHMLLTGGHVHGVAESRANQGGSVL